MGPQAQHIIFNNLRTVIFHPLHFPSRALFTATWWGHAWQKMLIAGVYVSVVEGPFSLTDKDTDVFITPSISIIFSILHVTTPGNNVFRWSRKTRMRFCWKLWHVLSLRDFLTPCVTRRRVCTTLTVVSVEQCCNTNPLFAEESLKNGFWANPTNQCLWLWSFLRWLESRRNCCYHWVRGDLITPVLKATSSEHLTRLFIKPHSMEVLMQLPKCVCKQTTFVVVSHNN